MWQATNGANALFSYRAKSEGGRPLDWSINTINIIDNYSNITAICWMYIIVKDSRQHRTIVVISASVRSAEIIE